MANTTRYALDHMAAAASSLAVSEDVLPTRLQACWHDHVQHVWEKPCLSADLAAEFRALWERYTAPAEDPHSTVLRPLDAAQQRAMADDIVRFAVAVARDVSD